MEIEVLMDSARLPTEIRELFHRVAAYPGGLRLLLRGYLESIAVLFGVHPSIIESAREALHSPATRAAAIAALQEASSTVTAGASPSSASSFAIDETPQYRNAEELARELGGHPAGADLLFHAPVETIAVLFAVHPNIVFEARRILIAGGFTPSSPDEED